MIDNYDSFVHNLSRYFRQLDFETEIVRNDETTVEQIVQMSPRAIVLSPGPCTPNEAGISLELVRHVHRSIPILGICLGHQVIVQALGGSVVCSPDPIHGQSSQVFHHGSTLFDNIPSPFLAGRYHSLVAEQSSLPDTLVPRAWTEDGILMAVQHNVAPVVGLQFHPESILTSCGHRLLTNFLNLNGSPVAKTKAHRNWNQFSDESDDTNLQDGMNKPYSRSVRFTESRES